MVNQTAGKNIQIVPAQLVLSANDGYTNPLARLGGASAFPVIRYNPVQHC